MPREFFQKVEGDFRAWAGRAARRILGDGREGWVKEIGLAGLSLIGDSVHEICAIAVEAPASPIYEKNLRCL